MAVCNRIVSRLMLMPKSNIPALTVLRTSHHPPQIHLEPDKAKYGLDEGPLIRIDRCPGREVVGFGMNSEIQYFDKTDFPYPAVRFRRETPEIKILREKEKGDWRKLTIEEKKMLYRHSFRYTFSEMDARTGQWKSIFGLSFFFHGLGLWWFMFVYWWVNRGELRPSLHLEAQQAQLQRAIAMGQNPIFGIASKWDYEKDDWKK